MYPGKYIKKRDVSLSEYDIERIWIKTETGRVEAWFSGVKNLKKGQKKPAVIFAHGNYELIDYCYQEIINYNRLGINVLLVEYPGYGRSEGTPSQDSIEDVFIKAYDLLVEKKTVDEKRIITHGRSLGGGAACLLAKKRRVSAIILQSAFTDLKQFAKIYFLPSFLVKDVFDNLSVVKEFKGPILIFHGKYDKTIPYKNGKKLYEQSQDAELVPMDCGHNDCPVYGEEFWRKIEEFINRALKNC